MTPIQTDIIDSYFTYKIIHCGLILLSIQLNPKDFPNCEHIPILFLLVPRITYLACIINKILDYYRIWNVINISSDYKYWFESYGVILKSQYPIGVLFDICCKNRDSIHFHISMNIGNSKVVTSLNNQYDELIDNYINWPSFLKNFFNIIKLSQIITDNNCRQFQSITKKKYEELIDWIQMTCSSTNQYDDIIQSFFGHIDKRCNIKSLPIRIHIIDSINLTSVSLLRYYPIKSGENLLTFEDIFIDIVPIRYIDKVELIIHGIRPPLNTPLLFIAINCIYIDGFIHIVLNNKY